MRPTEEPWAPDTHVFAAGETNCRKALRLLGELQAAEQR